MPDFICSLGGRNGHFNQGMLAQASEKAETDHCNSASECSHETSLIEEAL